MKFLLAFALLAPLSNAQELAPGGGSTGGGNGEQTSHALERLRRPVSVAEPKTERTQRAMRERVKSYIRGLGWDLYFLYDFFYHSTKVIQPANPVLQEMDKLGAGPRNIRKAQSLVTCGLVPKNFCKSIRVELRYDQTPRSQTGESLTFHVDPQTGGIVINVGRMFSDRSNYGRKTNVALWLHELARILKVEDHGNVYTANWMKAMTDFYHAYQYDTSKQRDLLDQLEAWCKTGPDNIFTNHGFAALNDLSLNLRRFGSDTGGLTAFSTADYYRKKCQEAIRQRNSGG